MCRELQENCVTCDVLVVGGGVAGVSFLQTYVRLNGSSGNNILVSASPFLKVFSVGFEVGRNIKEITVKEESHNIFTEKHPSFHFILGILKEIYTNNKYVIIESKTLNGSSTHKIFYKKLILTIGASPKLVQRDTKNVFAIRDDSSVYEMLSSLNPESRICVIGNGGIAMDVVNSLQSYKLHWVIKDSHIGKAFFDDTTAIFLQDMLQNYNENVSNEVSNFHENNKMKEKFSKECSSYSVGPSFNRILEKCNTNFKGYLQIFKDVFIDRICEVDECLNVTFSNGKTFAFDLVISAIGVESCFNVRVYEGVLEMDKEGFIKVDPFMRTSVDSIYAAGDCCTVFFDFEPSRLWFQMRLWNQAKLMGEYLAANIHVNFHVLSEHEKYLNVPIFFDLFVHATKFFNLPVVLLGKYNISKGDSGNIEVLLRVCKDKKEYVRAVLEHDKMIGAVLIGDVELAETFENLIMNGTNLSTVKDDLLDPDIDIADYFD